MIKVEVKNQQGITTNSGIFRNDQEADAWIALHNFSGATKTDVTQDIDKKDKDEKAMDYLNRTNWMFFREIEAGVPMPSKVKNKRIAAYDKIKRKEDPDDET